MSETTSKTCCVIDHGLFLPFALKLGEQFKHVYYWTPFEKEFPVINDCVLGDGYDEIERIDDFWPLKDQIDLFVFPDVGHSGLQKELVKQGFPVWGSRGGDSLELKRVKFKETLKELGLAVGPYQTCEGISALRKYLEDKKDCYVKVSKYRGSMETWHWIDQQKSAAMLDLLAMKFGPVQEVIPFIVEDNIPTEIEWGYDGYSVNGKFPAFSAQGPEVKDRCYIAAFTKYEDLPEQIREVNEKLSPVLEKFGYANFWSTELRIDEKGTGYFIDPCARCASPAGEAQIEMYENIAEIVWAGANGECIDPVSAAQFVVETIIDHTGDEAYWRTLFVPKEISQWVKIHTCCQVDDMLAIPPFPHSCDSIGAILGVGDTLEEAIAHLHKNVDILGDAPIKVHTDALVDALKEIHEADEAGVQMTDQKVPEPETALE